MEKQRKWRLFAILAVIALTIYNILPTIFYYSKPLKEPINEKTASRIAQSITERVGEIEKEHEDWIRSFAKLTQVSPKNITFDPKNPQQIVVSFTKIEDATRFRTFFPRAASLIPFAPAQLALIPQVEYGTDVFIQRKINAHLETDFFSFTPTESNEILHDRIKQLTLSLAGPSNESIYLTQLEQGAPPYQVIQSLADEINTFSQTFGDEHSIANRFAARFTQGFFPNRLNSIGTLLQSFESVRKGLAEEKTALLASEKPSDEKEQMIRLFEAKEKEYLTAENYIKNHTLSFSLGQDPWDLDQIEHLLKNGDAINLSSRNPLFTKLCLNETKDQIILELHPDVAAFQKSGKNKEMFEQLLMSEMNKIGHFSNEKLTATEQGVAIPLYHFPNTSGFLVLHLEKMAHAQEKQLVETLKSLWMPEHPDLQTLQIIDLNGYEKLPEEEKTLCFVAMSPLSNSKKSSLQFENNSLYLIGKGIGPLIQSYAGFPDSELKQKLDKDLQSLQLLLHHNGFMVRGTASQPTELVHLGDFIFEKSDWVAPLLAATRENFVVQGTKKYATLELTNQEQHLLTQNKIENAIHEDLLKWNDEYQAAQVHVDPRARFDVPKPTKNPFWNNCKLSLRKLVRGDERKIIRWGLDLSGGKTVQIELKDQNHRTIVDEAAIHQGINELYARINKMGLSEVSIRQMGTNIVLDFPSSQALSASDLIQASSMRFHLVNEKFSLSNPTLAQSVNRFLQEVWNEASISNRLEANQIHAIAYKRLHEETLRSEAAKTLLESGLRLTSPEESIANNSVDTSLSKIALLQGKAPSEWHGQSHPLLIVFQNYVIEGSNLENIRAGHDTEKGNYLSFDVRTSYQNKEHQTIDPQSALFAWSSTFSKEAIAGTSLENYSKGHGWRMAVILNDCVISAPTLNSPLQSSGMISGNFSQREVELLAADLKAGSLSFTPHILSEKNVNAELGQKDRIKGIGATFIALALVVGAMIAYYRFAGVVASIAVIFNLLILWATLQNLGAALTLSGLAGVILTVGMAVDANVLVFERIKEEFALSGKISSALSIGYQKAYSAIIDSNITTIIAALILLNFDAGPIKSFAVNLIIGIVSSMFTALFVTRFYFTGWAKNPKNKELKMSNLIEGTQINFLKYAKLSFAAACTIILVGSYLLFAQKTSILGMDFTGGYALNLEIENSKSEEKNYAQRVEKALLAAGAIASDFQVRELNPENHLRLFLGTSMEQAGKPFSNLMVETAETKTQFAFEKNPRIQWIVSALEKENIQLASHSLAQLDTNWTAMSGKMSDTMRNNALLGLLISFVSIFIYLSFRFEYKFAAAALICLLHDVLITIGAIGLLHAFGLPVQIDLNTIAALMTIIGYSLNDTIIIFDRIREEIEIGKKARFADIINHALNATLSRTTITSGTTLLVLIALVALGGSSIFSFALVMTIGIFFGTLSSWFIASPLILFFQKKEEKQELISA